MPILEDCGGAEQDRGQRRTEIVTENAEEPLAGDRFLVRESKRLFVASVIVVGFELESDQGRKELEDRQHLFSQR
jgi:hypothetical protein